MQDVQKSIWRANAIFNLPRSVHITTEFGCFQKFAPFNGRFHLITFDKMIMDTILFTLAWFSRRMWNTWNRFAPQKNGEIFNEKSAILVTISCIHIRVNLFTWNQMLRGIQRTDASTKCSYPILFSNRKQKIGMKIILIELFLKFSSAKGKNCKEKNGLPDGPQMTSGRGPFRTILE